MIFQEILTVILVVNGFVMSIIALVCSFKSSNTSGDAMLGYGLLALTTFSITMAAALAVIMGNLH